MSGWEFYAVTVATLGCISGIQVLGLNLQFAVAGIINFAYVVLVAAGAYATAIAELPPSQYGATYIGGFGWGFWPALLFGIAAAVGVAALLAFLVFRRLRHDYLALALVAIAQGLVVLVSNDPRLFNGVSGLNAVPGPSGSLVISAADQLMFLGISVGALVLTYAVTARIYASPLGRALRAVREDEDGLAGLGKAPLRLKLVAFLFGAAAAGLGGGLIVTYGGGWNSTSWQITEAMALLAAVIVGGRGRNAGAMLGVVVVFVGITEGSTYLPQFLSASGMAALQELALGLLLIGFLVLRPQGLLGEPRENYRAAAVVARQMTMVQRSEKPDRAIVGAGVDDSI